MVKGVIAGLHPAVVAMIASAGISLVVMSVFGQRELPNNLDNFNIISVVIFVMALVILRKKKPNPIHVMLVAGVLGIILYSVFPMAI